MERSTRDQFLKTAGMHTLTSISWVVAGLVAAAGTVACTPRPSEPVVPADMSGVWEGGYTLYDGGARPLNDSLVLRLTSDRGSVSGDGVRHRYLDNLPSQDASIEVSGSVAAYSFHLVMTDPATSHRAIFNGTIEDDTLQGNLVVDGNVIASLEMAKAAPYAQDPGRPEEP